MHNFRKLKIGQHCMDFVTDIYPIGSELLHEEKLGLISELLTAAGSIPLDKVGGYAKESYKSLATYLQISLGFAYELELAIHLNFLKEDKERTLTLDLK